MGDGKEEVKLLGAWDSRYVHIVKLALNFKGIKYELLEQDLVKKSRLLIKSNPIHKKVPVLIHNEKPICESLVIIKYLDDTWKENPLLPRDPYERAMARFWAKFVDEKLGENLSKVLYCDGEQQESGIKQAKEALEVLEGEIKGKTFFGGETIGFVDIALGYAPIWIGVIEEACDVKINDPTLYPCLAQWMENFMELPLFKESNVAPRENLVMDFKKIRQHTLANVA